MKLGVIGTGYVGLVTGSCFAESGNSVLCMDIDEEKVRLLSGGTPHIYEPGLAEVMRRNIKEGRLRFTTDMAEVVVGSDILFIAVSTPPGEDGSADISAVLQVAGSIGEHLDSYKIVVTKSTVPVGTTIKVKEAIARTTKGPFDVASNPEFLKEGAAVEDFMKPDRVVIGVDDPAVGERLGELYRPFMRSGSRVMVVSITSAELSKYAANAMLATRISFMNEMANLCELVGADVAEVREVLGADSRIGRSFLFPGLGYGGSCFPKDVGALIHIAREQGYEMLVCEATEHANRLQREIFWGKILGRFGGELGGKRFAVWGISFKPKTDDIREAPAIYIIDKLLAAGATVTAHDPAALENARGRFGARIGYAALDYDALEDADALVINTEWNEYRQPDFELMKARMRGNVIFDGRNLYTPSKLTELGFEYFPVGRSEAGK